MIDRLAGTPASIDGAPLVSTGFGLTLALWVSKSELIIC